MLSLCLLFYSCNTFSLLNGVIYKLHPRTIMNLFILKTTDTQWEIVCLLPWNVVYLESRWKRNITHIPKIVATHQYLIFVCNSCALPYYRVTNTKKAPNDSALECTKFSQLLFFQMQNNELCIVTFIVLCTFTSYH